MIEDMSGGGFERSLRELNFETNDRVPIVGGFLCKASFLERITGMRPFWDNPRRIAIEAYRRLGTDFIMQFVLPKRDEESTESITPTNFSKPTDKSIYESAEDVIEDIHGLPSTSELHRNYDSDSAYKEYVRLMREGQEEMGDMLWIPHHGDGCCGFMWYSKYGYKPYFLAMTKYPDIVEELFRFSGEWGRLKNKACAKAIRREKLLPFIYLGEDICYNRGPMVPVSLLKEIYFPHLKRALQPLKEVGAKIIWHSDGNILPILDDLLGCGADGFQGFQGETDERLEELASLRSRSGDKLILWGSISVTSTLPFGSVKDVEREVERCIDAAAEGGGFFIAPTSSVGPEVPDQNLIAMYRHAIQYGGKIRS